MAAIILNQAPTAGRRTVQTVLAPAGWRVICETGGAQPAAARLLQTPSIGRIRVVAGLDDDTLRGLGLALLLAADVLTGQQEATDLTNWRADQEARDQARAAANQEYERCLETHGVTVRCTGCGATRRILAANLPQWLLAKPGCCRKQRRKFVRAE